MEEESKISFWKKIKISIFGLEDYQKLAIQKPGSIVSYLAKLMLIFVFFLSIVLTYQFGTSINNVKQYIENEISEIHFENNVLKITAKENKDKPIIIENEKLLNGKIIIDTKDISEEQINKYTEDFKGYVNGVLILKDKVVFKTAAVALSTNISYADIAEQYHIVKLDKQEIVNMLSGSNVWVLYVTFFIMITVYLFVIYFSTVLLDALLYSLFASITGMISRLKLKFSACYAISVHALTLPIILNLAYMIINLLTGYTIKYFDIMYMAITCIYVITAILMIKSDMIKKQMELSRIISEQEKVKQELERQEQERKEEEQRERIRKEDEKKRKEKQENTSNDKKENKESKEKNGPQPEANIRTDNS